MDDKVKLFIAQNINQKNLTCNFFSPEGMGIKKFELLQDLALMTGAKVISETSGDAHHNINATYLGTCKSMTTTSTETILVFDDIENPQKEETIAWIQNELKDPTNKMDRWHLEDRLSKLAGGVATIMVSGNSEVEMKEKKTELTTPSTQHALLCRRELLLVVESHCTMRTKNFRSISKKQ